MFPSTRRFFKAIAERRQAQRTVRVLARMSDRQLEDLGLCRHDLIEFIGR